MEHKRALKEAFEAWCDAYRHYETTSKYKADEVTMLKALQNYLEVVGCLN